jgi:hypothetical protein
MNNSPKTFIQWLIGHSVWFCGVKDAQPEAGKVGAVLSYSNEGCIGHLLTEV